MVAAGSIETLVHTYMPNYSCQVPDNRNKKMLEEEGEMLELYSTGSGQGPVVDSRQILRFAFTRKSWPSFRQTNSPVSAVHRV
jgi:hypothetical protein